ATCTTRSTARTRHVRTRSGSARATSARPSRTRGRGSARSTPRERRRRSARTAPPSASRSTSRPRPSARPGADDPASGPDPDPTSGPDPDPTSGPDPPSTDFLAVEHGVGAVIGRITTATPCSAGPGGGSRAGRADRGGGSALREELAHARDDLRAVELDAAQHRRVRERAGRVLEVEPARAEEADGPGELARDRLGRPHVERPVAHVVGEPAAVVGRPAALAADPVVHRGEVLVDLL